MTNSQMTIQGEGEWAHVDGIPHLKAAASEITKNRYLDFMGLPS